MPKTKSFQLTSKIVSWLLVAIIALLVIGIGVSSWYLQQRLAEQVVAMDHAKIDAELSQTELQRSKTLEIYFNQNRQSVDKAAAVVSDTRTYQFGYQDQIVKDIQSYANKAGVSVVSYTFPEQTTATTTLDATGLKSVDSILAFKTPVPYNNFIIFLKYVEQNVTKMQVTDLKLDPDPNNGNVLEDVSVTLKVYVR